MHVGFVGSSGQSFGNFLAPGITFELEGLPIIACVVVHISPPLATIHPARIPPPHAPGVSNVHPDEFEREKNHMKEYATTPERREVPMMNHAILKCDVGLFCHRFDGYAFAVDSPISSH